MAQIPVVFISKGASFRTQRNKLTQYQFKAGGTERLIGKMNDWTGQERISIERQ